MEQQEQEKVAFCEGKMPEDSFPKNSSSCWYLSLLMSVSFWESPKDRGGEEASETPGDILLEQDSGGSWATNLRTKSSGSLWREGFFSHDKLQSWCLLNPCAQHVPRNKIPL